MYEAFGWFSGGCFAAWGFLIYSGVSLGFFLSAMYDSGSSSKSPVLYDGLTVQSSPHDECM
jgi:hypothetical protein